MLAVPFPITVCLPWGISKSPLIWPSLRLSPESFCLAQSPVSALVPRRRAAQLGHRGTLWGRRKCQESKQQAGTLQDITSRACIEGLNQQCYSQGTSSDGQAAKWSWDLEGLGTLPPLKYKKANKGGLQGEGTYIPSSLWEWQGNGNQEVEGVAHFGGPPELAGPSVEKHLGFCVPAQQK